MSDAPNPRLLGPPDGHLVERITRDAWGRRVPWHLFDRAVNENGTTGFATWEHCPQNLTGYLIFDIYKRFVPLWCARPEHIHDLVPLFRELPLMAPPPYTLYVPDYTLEALAVLKTGLVNFRVTEYQHRRATITFDTTVGPESAKPDGTGGPVVPAGLAPVAPDTGPRRPDPTGFPVLCGVPRGL